MQKVILIHWQADAVPTGGGSQTLVGMEMDEVWDLSWMPVPGMLIEFRNGDGLISAVVESVELMSDRRQLTVSICQMLPTPYRDSVVLSEIDLKAVGFVRDYEHKHITVDFGAETSKFSSTGRP